MKYARARVIPPLFFLVIVSLILIIPNYAYADELIVTTNNSSYSLGATVNVTGKLTLRGIPVSDGLVAVQVDDSLGNVKLLRVIPTGTPPSPWKVRIASLVSVDSQDNPKSTFTRGGLSFFKVTVENLDINNVQTMITFDLFDSIGRSVSFSFWGGNLQAGQSLTRREDILIPNDFFGNAATCYVNVLTGNVQPAFPKLAGQPCCPEQSVAVTITGSSSGSADSTPVSAATSPGSYTLAFKLPDDAMLGNYTVYSSARYNAWTSTKFDYYWLITDVNRDGKVNVVDISAAGRAFGSRTGGPKYNAMVDINNDGIINIIDVTTIARDFGRAIVQ
jgi:hypothetical protein